MPEPGADILVVAPSQLVASTVRVPLEEGGYRVRVVADGLAALPSSSASCPTSSSPNGNFLGSMGVGSATPCVATEKSVART